MASNTPPHVQYAIPKARNYSHHQAQPWQENQDRNAFQINPHGTGPRPSEFEMTPMASGSRPRKAEVGRISSVPRNHEFEMTPMASGSRPRQAEVGRISSVPRNHEFEMTPMASGSRPRQAEVGRISSVPRNHEFEMTPMASGSRPRQAEVGRISSVPRNHEFEMTPMASGSRPRQAEVGRISSVPRNHEFEMTPLAARSRSEIQLPYPVRSVSDAEVPIRGFNFRSLQDLLSAPIPLAHKQSLLEEIQRIEAKQPFSVTETSKQGAKMTSSIWSKLRLGLWDSTLWKIESQYGSAVSSYFKFLKWTMGLNIVSLIFILLLIIVPQLVEHTQTAVPPLALECQFDHHEPGQWVPQANAPECCSRIYLNGTRELTFDTSDFFGSLWSFIQDLLQGTNWMENTALFYGYYSGTFKFDLNGVTFDFPLAYILVMVAVYVINLLAVVFASAKSVHSNYKTIGSASFEFSHLIFATWDHKICKAKTVGVQQRDIKSRLIVALQANQRARERQEMTTGSKCQLWSVRVLINVIVLGLLGGAAYGIYLLTGIAVPQWLLNNQCTEEGSSFQNTTFVCFLLNYVPSLVITAANLVLPILFSMLIYYEKYSTNVELVLTLGRCILLRMASLIIAFMSIYTTVNCNYAQGCANLDGSISPAESNAECEPTQSPMTTCSNGALEESQCDKRLCWESYLGQQFYQLTFLDFLVQIFIMVIIDFPRVRVLRHCDNGFSNFFGTIEFGISKNVLDIVYTQTICWLVVFFAPLIVLVTIIKSFIIFWLRIIYVLYICKPSSVPYSAARASSLFKGFLLFAFALVTIAIGITIGNVQPSLACGPFRDVQCANPDGICRVYDYIIFLIEDNNNWALKIVRFFGQPGVLWLIIIALCVALYFVSVRSISHRNFGQQIHRELIQSNLRPGSNRKQ